MSDSKSQLDQPLGWDPDNVQSLVTLREVLSWPAEKRARFTGIHKEAAAKLLAPPPVKRGALQDGEFKLVDPSEIDYELDSPNKFFGTHVNLIPMQSAMQGARAFYGARFSNQALPVEKPEAPWVQCLADNDPQGRSFEEIMGESCGAVKSKGKGKVLKVEPDGMDVEEDGQPRHISLYNAFPFNRKSQISNTPMVKAGDEFELGHLLAKSNYTDDKGTLALGLNARVGLVPYKGYTLDDALVISEAFAKRLASNNLYGFDTDFKRGVKAGKGHYIGIFPNKYTNDQLGKLDDEGIAMKGQIINPGDPIILATKPRVISSTSAQLGLLSKHMKNARSDAATLWEEETPGKVEDVERTRGGVKVNISTVSPTKIGDKAVFRSGQKGVISHIIPDEHMPRTVDGRPLEVLQNPLGIPSRVNNSFIYELLLGKVAEATGQPIKVPGFNAAQEKWFDITQDHLNKAGLKGEEEVFDPQLNRKLENPITVGSGFVLKLHHTGHSKLSSRGQGAYSSEQQPLHGGSEQGLAKRLSGLEVHSLMSSGAYNVLREGSTLRGQKNDEYWRQLRQGYSPPDPGESFVWQKFHALLTGSGYLARKMPGGKERISFWTDKDLDQHRPIEVKTGDLVDLGTMAPVKGGLFDPSITGANAWGKISLPFPVPNPAAEDSIRKLLGLTQKQFRAVMAGQMDMPAHLMIPKKKDANAAH